MQENAVALLRADTTACVRIECEGATLNGTLNVSVAVDSAGGRITVLLKAKEALANTACLSWSAVMGGIPNVTPPHTIQQYADYLGALRKTLAFCWQPLRASHM